METEISFYLLLADLEVLQQKAKSRELVEEMKEQMEQEQYLLALVELKAEHKQHRDKIRL